MDIVSLLADHPHPRVLDLGGRAVCSTQWQPPTHWERIGVDIHPGPAVDVVADLHELSRHVAAASVDAAYSIVVWEHLLMPWKAVLELNRVLRPGGIAWIVSHKDYPIHDAPWDFYRFGRDSWSSLFNLDTGFEVLSTAQHSPLRVVPLAAGIPSYESFGANQVLVRKIAEADPGLCRWDVALSSVLPSRHTYARKPTFREHAANKARRLLLRFGRGQPELLLTTPGQSVDGSDAGCT